MKKIIYNAIDKKSNGIFIIHNHPGGSLKPSRSDIKTTNELRNLLAQLGMHLYDSIIIAKNEYFSIADFIDGSDTLNQLKLNRK